MKIDKGIFVRSTLVLLAFLILLCSIYGLYFNGVMRTVSAVFFMVIGLRIIKEFLKNEGINLGASVIYKEDGALLRFSLFALGAFLYGGGIFQLFGMKE